ncbi:MAG TPA: glycosyltransferase family 4 protein [Chloroflexia bacterium]|nr:glycosyltransferase family 4 protein [Chloroflexia bacterium]
MAFCVRALFPQHGYGGLERAASAQVRHLLARGVDVSLYTQPLPVGQPFTVPEGSPGHLTVRTVRYNRFPLRANGIPSRLTNYRAFAASMGERVERVARMGKIDCIYAHGLCAWGVRSAAEWGVPLVANPHGLEEFKVRDPLKRLAYAPFRAWVREGCRAADRVLATDHAMRGEVASLLKIPKGKVVVIPNGVDISLIATLVSEAAKGQLIERWPALAADPAALHGISVGRLEENKGFEVLLRALASVRDELGENWSWVLIGEGTLRSHLKSVAAALGLSDHVIFAGALGDQELHTLYSMSNLFAHPALYEGSSLVTLEAMVHALPVVVSAVGGIPDKVVEGETGSLVQPGEPGELGAKIAWLASRPDIRRQMGERGARLAAERFSMERVTALLKGLFMEIISEKSPCRDEESVQSPC